MLTFLELYQTLLGFILFKLYTDAGLVYPPPLNAKKDESAAGIGAFSLQDITQPAAQPSRAKAVELDGRKISTRDVRQTIKNIEASHSRHDPDVEMSNPEMATTEVEEEFIPRASLSNPGVSVSTELPTLQSISSLPQSLSTLLFSPYTFFLSREVSRPIFEFMVRSFGGKIGWSASSGSGSPFEETDGTITHVIIDRPLVVREESPSQRELRLRRKYVQPQWIVDCINSGKILLEGPYGQGKTLPPHLSPFGEYEGAYDPAAGPLRPSGVEQESELEVDEVSEEDEEDQGDLVQAAAEVATGDSVDLRAAELAAEAAGVDYGTFEAKVKKLNRKQMKKPVTDGVEDGEKDMNKMMMSNKQRKLYEKMKYSQKKKEIEVSKSGISLDAVLMSSIAGDTGYKEEGFAETEKARRSVIIHSQQYYITCHRSHLLVVMIMEIQLWIELCLLTTSLRLPLAAPLFLAFIILSSTLPTRRQRRW